MVSKGRYNIVIFMQQILRIFAVILWVTVGTSTAGHAQSLGLSFGADGRLATGFTNQVQGADLFFFGDATARLSLNNSSFGFELGVFGLANVVDTPHETYGTFTFDLAQGGRVLLGVTRPAYDSFAVSAVDSMQPSLGVLRTAATRSEATYGAMFAGYLPYGLRFETQTDAFRFAASFATVPNRDKTIVSVGFAVPVGDLTFETAVEASRGATTEFAGKLQVKGKIGQVNGGVGFYMPGTVGGPRMAELFAAFDPTEKITVSGVVQIPLGGNDATVAGVSVRYAYSSRVGVMAGVLHDADAKVAYSAMLDWKF